MQKDFDIKKVIYYIIFVCIVMSVKNSYLLARHVTEVLLILYSIYCYKHHENKEDKHV